MPMQPAFGLMDQGWAAAETSDDRAARSRATVLDSFTIQAMATALSGVYSHVHESERRIRDWVMAAQ